MKTNNGEKKKATAAAVKKIGKLHTLATKHKEFALLLTMTHGEFM